MWYFEMLPHLDLTLISRCVAFCGTSCITMFNSPPQMQILRERIPNKMFIWVKKYNALDRLKPWNWTKIGLNFPSWVILKEAINHIEFICIFIDLILWNAFYKNPMLKRNSSPICYLKKTLEIESNLCSTIILSYWETASWYFYIPGNGIFPIVDNQHV